MNLQRLKDTGSNGLIHCSICKEHTPFTVAAKTGWTVDSDHDSFLRIFEPNVYYCVGCQHFLVNEMADEITEVK